MCTFANRNRTFNDYIFYNLIHKVMTKQELIEKVAATGLTKAQAKAALEAALDGIKAAVVNEGKIQLLGFGTFSVNERPAREGINPATKEKIQIAAKKVVKFKAAAAIDEALNN